MNILELFWVSISLARPLLPPMSMSNFRYLNHLGINVFTESSIFPLKRYFRLSFYSSCKFSTTLIIRLVTDDPIPTLGSN